MGGHNKVPMDELKPVLEKAGFHKIETYLQSGNIICYSAAAAIQIEIQVSDAIEMQFGFRPSVLALSFKIFDKAMKENPFLEEATSDPKSVHLLFLSQPTENPDLSTLDAVKTKTENFHFHNSVLYIHAPRGIGRSKLAKNVEKVLSVPVISRNWRTLTQVNILASSSTDNSGAKRSRNLLKRRAKQKSGQEDVAVESVGLESKTAPCSAKGTLERTKKGGNHIDCVDSNSEAGTMTHPGSRLSEMLQSSGKLGLLHQVVQHTLYQRVLKVLFLLACFRC